MSFSGIGALVVIVMRVVDVVEKMSGVFECDLFIYVIIVIECSIECRMLLLL